MSDRETVEKIKENPDLQYFIGFEAYNNQASFDASMLVHFRERIDVDLINQINSYMVKTRGEKTEDKGKKTHKIRKNQGA
ncbi:MAG: transposase [Okeania sp. SIO3H1]|nr:transposase [Okeania sp. SIO3H1]